MNRFIIFYFAIFLIFLTSHLSAQEFYWVSFSNKNNSAYSLSNPQDYLSARAIERRAKQNITIDSLDLPVNMNYIDSVLEIGAEMVHASKWLNGLTLKTEVDSFPTKVMALHFVKSVQLTKPSLEVKSANNKFGEFATKEKVPIDTTSYGASVFQTGLLNGQFLHNQNYKGQGMHIAVLDAGFYKVDEYSAFDSLWLNNQILGVNDFIESDSDIFETDYHGMSVLSCMGGNVPGELLGTATKASFWLLRSEFAPSEYIIEEDNWVVAAEFADSVGVDIINSSLGYYDFDDAETNHTYADMDGKTTRVTQAANIAASKGMLVFSSAGNEGSKPWKYIIAPSDGDKVIGVGAVNKLGIAAGFTSYGPASDGDIKPNLSALGWNTYLVKSDGALGYSSGTSFSSPVLAGMAACLWQANPDATALDVKQALEQSAGLYNAPDSLLGYGIPDMKLADQILKPSLVKKWETNNKWKVYPNPFKDFLVLQHKNNSFMEEVDIQILSLDGRLCGKWKRPGSAAIELNELQTLPQGIYLLQISSVNSSETIKLHKQL